MTLSATPHDYGQNIIGMARNLSDVMLAHAILDLSRAARMEITMLGLDGVYLRLPATTYESVFLFRAMPEISRRLNLSSNAPLLLQPAERSGVKLENASATRLREVAGLSWSLGNFSYLSDLIGAQNTPLSVGRRQFALEVIARPPETGNIVEIALSRLVAPVPDDNADVFAKRIRDASGDPGCSGIWRWPMGIDETGKILTQTADIGGPPH